MAAAEKAERDRISFRPYGLETHGFNWPGYAGLRRRAARRGALYGDVRTEVCMEVMPRHKADVAECLMLAQHCSAVKPPTDVRRRLALLATVQEFDGLVLAIMRGTHGVARLRASFRVREGSACLGFAPWRVCLQLDRRARACEPGGRERDMLQRIYAILRRIYGRWRST